MTMLIMCKLFSTVGAEQQEAINVFGYKSFIAVTNELVEFTTRFKSDILPQIEGILSVQTLFTRIESYDLADPTGEYFLPIVPAEPGGNTGETLPPWITLSFEYRRKNRTQRSGRKGFGQLPESCQNDGVLVAGYLTSADALAGVLASPIQVALIDTWFPVILRRPSPPSTVWQSSDIQTVVFKGLGTQNTRKRR